MRRVPGYADLRRRMTRRMPQVSSATAAGADHRGQALDDHGAHEAQQVQRVTLVLHGHGLHRLRRGLKGHVGRPRRRCRRGSRRRGSRRSRGGRSRSRRFGGGRVARTIAGRRRPRGTEGRARGIGGCAGGIGGWRPAHWRPRSEYLPGPDQQRPDQQRPDQQRPDQQRPDQQRPDQQRPLRRW